MTLLAILFSLLTHVGAIAPLSAAELAPEVYEAGAVPVLAVYWDDPICGEDFCWLVAAERGGRLWITWNAGEVVAP